MCITPHLDYFNIFYLQQVILQMNVPKYGFSCPCSFQNDSKISTTDLTPNSLSSLIWFPSNFRDEYCSTYSSAQPHWMKFLCFCFCLCPSFLSFSCCLPLGILVARVQQTLPSSSVICTAGREPSLLRSACVLGILRFHDVEHRFPTL